MSNRTKGVIFDDYGDDADRERLLIIFWKGPQDWTSG
jgi:hypothetical protein